MHGADLEEGMSGYVLPYIDEAGRTCLVDFDTFEPILMGITYDKFYGEFNEATSKTAVPIRDYLENNAIYLKFYDQKHGGVDEQSEYSGYVFQVEANGINYLVDCTHPDKVIVSNYKSAEANNDATPGYLKITTTTDKTVQYLKDALPIEENSQVLKMAPTK